MAIDNNLEIIKHGRYGRDVREAIHNAIRDCYNDGHAGAIDLSAREDLAELIPKVDAAIVGAVDASIFFPYVPPEVDSGFCCVLQKGEHAVIIDLNTYAAYPYVKAEMWKHGIRYIDMILFTHWHTDHTGYNHNDANGWSHIKTDFICQENDFATAIYYPPVVDEFIREAQAGGSSYTTDQPAKLKACFEIENATPEATNYKPMPVQEPIEWNGISITCYNISDTDIAHYQSLNDTTNGVYTGYNIYSALIYVETGNFRLCVTGDMEGYSEKWTRDQGYLMPSTVVTAPHHGLRVDRDKETSMHYSAVPDSTGQNPVQKKWYERSGSSPNYTFTLSSDTMADNSKTYYAAIVEFIDILPILNPRVYYIPDSFGMFYNVYYPHEAHSISKTAVICDNNNGGLDMSVGPNGFYYSARPLPCCGVVNSTSGHGLGVRILHVDEPQSMVRSNFAEKQDGSFEHPYKSLLYAIQQAEGYTKIYLHSNTRYVDDPMPVPRPSDYITRPSDIYIADDMNIEIIGAMDTGEQPIINENIYISYGGQLRLTNVQVARRINMDGGRLYISASSILSIEANYSYVSLFHVTCTTNNTACISGGHSTFYIVGLKTPNVMDTYIINCNNCSIDASIGLYDLNYAANHEESKAYFNLIDCIISSNLLKNTWSILKKVFVFNASLPPLVDLTNDRLVYFNGEYAYYAPLTKVAKASYES